MHTRDIEYGQKNIDYFWDNVIVGEQEECWEWCGKFNHDGYGEFSIGGVSVRSHRFSYTIHYGQIPRGMVIRHFVCDNPACCNPFHLKVGTQSDNIQDTCARNNQVRLPGEMNAAAILREEQVIEIRESYSRDSTLRYIDLAKKYGVSIATIRFIIKGFTWKSVGGPIIIEDLTRRHSKINMEIANQIRQDYASGVKNISKLSRKYGIKRPSIINIIQNITWKE